MKDEHLKQNGPKRNNKNIIFQRLDTSGFLRESRHFDLESLHKDENEV